MSKNINAAQWTLFDKIMYGGLGYGAFCLPTDFFKVIIAILFPPLGEVINIVEDTVSDTFPYITWDSIKVLCTYKSLNTIVYSFLLTALFYIPGLIYTLTNIVERERKVSYSLSDVTNTGVQATTNTRAKTNTELTPDYSLKGTDKISNSNNLEIGNLF